jgi:hypothetical protein
MRTCPGWLRLCVVPLGLAACAGDDEPAPRPPNATLRDLPGPVLAAAIHSGADADETSRREPRVLTLFVNYDADAFLAAHGECAVLGDSLEATIAGRRAEAHFRGGGPDAEGDGCGGARFRAEVDDRPSGEIRVADDSGAITASFDAGALERHTVVPVSSSSWSFRAGERVTVRPSPGDDASGILGVKVMGERPDGIFLTFPVESVTVVGSEVSFSIPPVLPRIVDEYLAFDREEQRMAAIACEGADRCEMLVDPDVYRAIELR